jgi:hypothetical protein
MYRQCFKRRKKSVSDLARKRKAFASIFLKSQILQAHRTNSNAVQQISFKFSNPLAISITVHSLYLLTDNDRINETNDIAAENFHLKIVDFEEFDVPSFASDHTCTINFTTNKLGPFQIVGYVINSFSTFSKCLFVSLLKDNDELNSKFSIKKHSKISAMQATYDFDVSVEMPLIDDIILAQNIVDHQFETLDLGSESEGSFLECFQGEK